MSVHLYHFSQKEFTRNGRDWWPWMSKRLLVCADIFRFRWSEYKGEDAPFRISPNPGALGRVGPTYHMSDHNLAVHNEVCAIDGFPAGMNTREDAEAAYRIAVECGITAFGLYPLWELDGVVTPGIHIGDRREARMGNPATWGGVPDPDGGQMYTTLATALELMPE